jgi:hypothetical protein
MLRISKICRTMPYHAPELRGLLWNPLNHPDFPEDIGMAYLYAYLDFLWDHNKENPSNVLALLSSTGHMRRFNFFASGFFNVFSFETLFRIHISICNSMARTGRRLFCVKNLRILSISYGWSQLSDSEQSEPGVFHSVGICASEARAGDIVVIISGVPVPLVVRRSHRGLECLVSPAIVVGAMEGQAWKSYDWKAGEDGVLDIFNLM